MIEQRNLPSESLLQTYRANGAYTDCFSTEIRNEVSHEEFLHAFYTTWAFKLERAILKWVVDKPSTDEEVAQLAAGEASVFAAWVVEQRATDQILLCDFSKRTRSWFMVERVAGEHGRSTRLYFGSAIVPVQDRKTGRARLGFVFTSLLGFHKLYSRVLLRSARARLLATRARREGSTEG